MRGFSTRLTIVANYVTCVTFFAQIFRRWLHFSLSEYLIFRSCEIIHSRPCVVLHFVWPVDDTP
jgi:hypothetical protein